MGGKGTQQVLNKSALPYPGPAQRAHCPFQAHALEPGCPVLTLALLSCSLGQVTNFLCLLFSSIQQEFNKNPRQVPGT